MFDQEKRAQLESAVVGICGDNKAMCEAVMAGYDAIYEGVFTKLAATAALVLGLGIGSHAAAGEVVAKNCHGNACQIYDGGSLVGFTDSQGNLYDADSHQLIEKGVVKGGKINAPKDDVKCDSKGCHVYDDGNYVGDTDADSDMDFGSEDDDEGGVIRF